MPHLFSAKMLRKEAHEIAGYFMRHKTGFDVAFSWNKDDPDFSEEWERIPAVAQPAPASAGRGPTVTDYGTPVDKCAARELDLEAEFEAWFEKWRVSTWHPLPSDIAAGKLEPSVHWNTNAKRSMRIAYFAARSAAQSTAPVSTEQAGDAREQVQHVTWMVGRRFGRTHALAQQIIDNLSDEAKARTSYGNIRDVLDAVHKMNRAPSPNNSPMSQRSENGL